MAEAPDQLPDSAPALSDVADAFAKSVLSPENLQKVGQMLTNKTLEGEKHVLEMVFRFITPAFELFLRAILTGLEAAEPSLDAISNIAVDAVLGEGPRRARIPNDVGARILQKLAPPSSTLEPGTAGAEQYLSLITHLNIETWLLGFVTELIAESADIIRGAGGQVHSVAELREIVVQVFGGGRITRRVLAPFIDAGIVTPAKWATQKQYRPSLLSPAEAIRQGLTGDWTPELVHEELARQGWSDDRILALIRAQRKFVSHADGYLLVRRGEWTQQQALDHIKQQGYTQAEAETIRRLEGLRRIEALEGQESTAIVGSYVAREIDQPTFTALLGRYVHDDVEVAFLEELAELRRGLVIKHLSPTDARRLALKKILSVIDYRRALERDGYGFDDIDALELELRQELDDARTLEQHKADQAAARDAEKQAAADAKTAREAELAARNALPTLTEFRRAYVRGLITRDQLSEAITREKIAITGDDLAILLADADTDRAARDAEIEKRAAADAKKPDPALPLATLESSVLRGILTIDAYARELLRRGYDDSESAIAVALLRDRQAQQDEAQQQKAAAAEKAARAGVPLATFERAVRAGVRTLDDYGAYLDRIETPAVGKALILDLLRTQLAEDAAAVKARAVKDAAAAEKGIALTERRRAVIAGVRPRTYYEAALRDAGWSVDDQTVELALVDVEIGQAADARARREQLAADKEAARVAREAAAAEKAAKANAPPPAPELALTQLERAVKLGLLAPDAMREELYTRGYTADDVELLVGIVVAGIPTARTAATRETAIAAELQAKDISLADLQAAVLHGYRTIADYAAELRGRGYGDDDVLLLGQLLEDRVALEQEKLRAGIAARLAKMDGAPPLEEILAAVDAGELPGDQLAAVLERFGIDTLTALLYARLVLVFGA